MILYFYSFIYYFRGLMVVVFHVVIRGWIAKRRYKNMLHQRNDAAIHIQSGMNDGNDTRMMMIVMAVMTVVMMVIMTMKTDYTF